VRRIEPSDLSDADGPDDHWNLLHHFVRILGKLVFQDFLLRLFCTLLIHIPHLTFPIISVGFSTLLIYW